MKHQSDLDAEFERPIGVFDSGIGGLTVVGALRRLLPNEQILYLGDTARVPYGGKSAATVERYSLEITSMLLEENCKAIVVACNTASALALAAVESVTAVPVIGVIRPGAEAAVATTRNNRIGVIGTRATIRSGAYERAIRALAADARVIAKACPLFVPLIEEGWLDNSVTDAVIEQYLSPLLREEIDTLVLGCTHYPLLRGAIERYLGKNITLVDSAENCARAVERELTADGLHTAKEDRGSLSVALTDPPDRFLEVAREALQLEIGEVQQRQIIHPLTTR